MTRRVPLDNLTFVTQPRAAPRTPWSACRLRPATAHVLHVPPHAAAGRQRSGLPPPARPCAGRDTRKKPARTPCVSTALPPSQVLLLPAHALWPQRSRRPHALCPAPTLVRPAPG